MASTSKGINLNTITVTKVKPGTKTWSIPRPGAVEGLGRVRYSMLHR